MTLEDLVDYLNNDYDLVCSIQNGCLEIAMPHQEYPERTAILFPEITPDGIKFVFNDAEVIVVDDVEPFVTGLNAWIAQDTP